MREDGVKGKETRGEEITFKKKKGNMGSRGDKVRWEDRKQEMEGDR